MLEGLKRTTAADAGIITVTLPAVVATLGVLFAVSSWRVCRRLRWAWP